VKTGRRSTAFWLLAVFFALFVLFLYGPTITIVVLSFQGPSGGLTFPMNGVSVHWFKNLFEKQMVGDFAGSFERSMALGVAAMLVTVVASFSAGLAFRTRFRGVALGKLRRPGEEREAYALETVFGNRFNDGRFPAGFGQRSGDEFLIDETYIARRKFRFFQQLI